MLYDNKTLLELMKSGDLLAVQVLIDKLTQAEAYDKRDTILNNGLVLGSAYSANDIAIGLKVSASDDKFISEQDRKNQFKNSLMYRVLSFMYGNYDIESTVTSFHESKTTLTKAEWQDIRNATDKLYNHMNELRAKNGFAPFQHTDKYTIVNKFEQELLSNGMIK